MLIDITVIVSLDGFSEVGEVVLLSEGQEHKHDHDNQHHT